MRTYSAAITVEFKAYDAEEASEYQSMLADELKRFYSLVYTDTIGPPECIEGCDESEEG